VTGVQTCALPIFEDCLNGHKNLWNHIWIESCKRSSISYRNNYKLPHNILEKCFYHMLKIFRDQDFSKKFDFPFDVYILDSTTISLPITLFPWAYYRTHKWAVKIHTLLGNDDPLIPTFLYITDWKYPDNKATYEAMSEIKKWWCIVFDRYYVDFKVWKKLDDQGKFFVSRTKKNTNYCVMKYNSIEHEKIILDAEIELTRENIPYKKRLRLIKALIRDEEEEKEIVMEFISNLLDQPAILIAEIYKHRRKIETFFRRIKQNLHIKTFFWTSENAVRNQIWTAMIYYLILQFIAFQAKIQKEGLLRLSRLLSEFCMTRRNIFWLLRCDFEEEIIQIRDWPIQTSLF